MCRCAAVSLILLLLCSGLGIAADKLILIGKNDPINNNDILLRDHLIGLGLDVEYHSEPEKHPVDTNGAVGMFISESVTSGNIGPAYDLPIPVIMSEPGLIDDMKMGTGQDNAGATSIEIVDPNHPITEGFSGVVKVLSQPGVMEGASALEGEVQILATLEGNPGMTMVFVYEKGAQMQGQEAPARRAFVFNEQYSNPLMNNDGWTIVERAVTWVLGTAVSVDYEGTLATSWGALRSY
jgi:hypothetical protein